MWILAFMPVLGDPSYGSIEDIYRRKNNGNNKLINFGEYSGARADLCERELTPVW